MVKRTTAKFLVLILLAVLVSCFDSTESDTTAPVIVSTSPANGATNVDTTTTKFTITFNEEMDGDFNYYGLSGYPRPGTGIGNDYIIEWSSDKKRFSFTILNTSLIANEEYGIQLNAPNKSNYFQDVAGNRLETFEWRFTTEP